MPSLSNIFLFSVRDMSEISQLCCDVSPTTERLPSQWKFIDSYVIKKDYRIKCLTKAGYTS